VDFSTTHLLLFLEFNPYSFSEFIPYSFSENTLWNSRILYLFNAEFNSSQSVAVRHVCPSEDDVRQRSEHLLLDTTQQQQQQQCWDRRENPADITE